MKKITYILFAALMIFSACNNNVEPEFTDDAAQAVTELKVNFTISTGEATKAIKTGWEDGDKIFVLFDNQLSLPDQYLVLTYASGVWNAQWIGGLASSLATRTSGTLSAFYVQFWDTMHLSYNPSVTSPEYERGTCWFIEPRRGDEKVWSDFYSCVDASYTISEDTVTATINLGVPENCNFVHFFVPGLEQEDGRYTLSVEPELKAATLAAYKPGEGFIIDKGSSELVGYPFGDGISFVGVLPDNLCGAATDYTFTLRDNSSVNTDMGLATTWSYSVTGKTLASRKAVAFPSTDRWTNATYGDATLRAVPLCEYDGQVLYFANINIGATWPVGPESYGNHFQWAGTKPHPWAYEENEFDDVLGEIPYHPDAPEGWGDPGGTVIIIEDPDKPGEGGYYGEVTAPYLYKLSNSPARYTKYLTGPKCALGAETPDGWFETYYPNWHKQFIDHKTVLDAKDDAATAILGDPWRIPTREEWQALIDECVWTYDAVNRGTKVTGKGAYAGNWIYLPEIRYDAYEHFDGRYMSATLFVHEDYDDGTGNDNIWALDFGNGPGKYLYSGFGRANLLPIRAVRNSPM